MKSFAGPDQPQPFLAGCDVLVCLLPLTPATRGILNRKLFSALSRAGAAGPRQDMLRTSANTNDCVTRKDEYGTIERPPSGVILPRKR